MRSAAPLTEFIQAHQPLCVLTGAGCSTSSGIFDYRDAEGQWKRPQPVLLDDFLKSPHARRQYWARSMLGWPRFHAARPSYTHQVLVELAHAGFIQSVVTQNVDDLHELAGQPGVIPLHGSLSTVTCVNCGAVFDRQSVQEDLETQNPRYLKAAVVPDAGGESYFSVDVDESFAVPGCGECGGLLKPDVVFFGGSIDPQIRDMANNAVAKASGLLVVGSSLMVFSAFRLVKLASQRQLPIAVVGLGKTRADKLATLHVSEDIDRSFQQVQHDLQLA